MASIADTEGIDSRMQPSYVRWVFDPLQRCWNAPELPTEQQVSD